MRRVVTVSRHLSSLHLNSVQLRCPLQRQSNCKWWKVVKASQQCGRQWWLTRVQALPNTAISGRKSGLNNVWPCLQISKHWFNLAWAISQIQTTQTAFSRSMRSNIRHRTTCLRSRIVTMRYRLNKIKYWKKSKSQQTQLRKSWNALASSAGSTHSSPKDTDRRKKSHSIISSKAKTGKKTRIC